MPMLNFRSLTIHTHAQAPARASAPTRVRFTPEQPQIGVQVARAPVRLRRLRASDSAWLPPLVDLLIDNVHRGASLGFLAPLTPSAALAHWQEVLAQLDPHRSLWVASESERPGPLVQGAVQLSLCPQANGHHRGEVQGLMVHSHARGRGIASRLMAAVECAALAQGRSLLVLDTPAGSQAEAVYAHLGWQRAGEIPDYAACAEGRLHGTARYFKRLPSARG